jgi:hypothetical protein
MILPEILSKALPGLNKVIVGAKDVFSEMMAMFPGKPRSVIGLLQGTRKFIQNPMSTLFLYNTEKHADSFAVDYGYGPHLATALRKLHIQENSMSTKVYYDTPGLNWVMDFFDLTYELVSRPFNGYPNEQNRIRTLMDRLRRASKDPNLDPRARIELDRQLDAIEHYYYNEYLSISTDENKKRVFTWMFHYTVEKTFAGKADLREILHAVDPKKYN